MSIIRSIAQRFGFVHRSDITKQRRSYDAAIANRLTAAWTTSQLSADTEIFRDYRRCVDRSRDLERNNDYMRNFFRLLNNNVLGHAGIGLQMKVPGPNGALDTYANSVLEEAWREWGKKETCTVAGDDSWEDVQALLLRAAARDGNVFVRRLKGFDNPFGFSIQLFESDHLDTNYNTTLPNGNQIRFGIEFTPFRKRVAYYFLKNHPGDIGIVGQNAMRRERFPAEEITHLYIRERIGQSIGMPWVISSIRRLNMLGGYEEAELVAARVGASKMGFFENQTPEDWPGPSDVTGNKIMNAEPGTFENLDPGQKFVAWDPQHPNQAYAPFVVGCLRGIAAGIGEAYHTLANDLSGVNYSSARIGMLEARENYKVVQGWFIRQLVTDIFKDALEMFLLKKVVNLPAAKLAKFNSPDWKARRWPWVDPEKDVNAAILGIRAGLTSQRAIIGEAGGDIEDTFNDLQADEELAAEKNLQFPALEEPPKQASANVNDQNPADVPRGNGTLTLK